MNNRKKILFCDNDKSIQEVVEIIVEEAGYEIETISGSDDIFRKIKNYKPDLLLLDLWMPNTSGREIVRKIKGDKQTKNIPIIIVSAIDQSKEIAKSMGVQDFLAKPFNIEDLTALVDKYLKK